MQNSCSRSKACYVFVIIICPKRHIKIEGVNVSLSLVFVHSLEGVEWNFLSVLCSLLALVQLHIFETWEWQES